MDKVINKTAAFLKKFNIPLFRSLSFWAVLISFGFIVKFNFKYQRWATANVIDWDVTSYYDYLPAYFIHGDLTLKFTEDTTKHYRNLHQFWPETAPNGGYVIKTTMGLAFLYAPAFLITYAIEGGDGFAEPYEKALHLACMFYVLIGLIYLRRILRLFYSEWVSALTVFFIAVGTNLFYYSVFEAAYPHAFNFSLFCVFIYYSVRWLQEHKLRHMILLGLVGGLIVLIRPVNILIYIFPFLFQVTGKESFKQRINELWNYKAQVILMCVCAFLVIFPQLLYWKMNTGQWFFNSYVGERFFFSNPRYLECLISYRKGWLVYTPMAFFMLLGFITLYKEKRGLFWPVFIYFLLSSYVMFSWWCWWYGGGFGMRPMVDMYGIYALSLASFFAYFLSRKKLIVSAVSLVFAFFFVYLNVFQTEQYSRSLIHWDSMTKKSYWIVFLKLQLTPEEAAEFNKNLQGNDPEKAKQGIDEYGFSLF